MIRLVRIRDTKGFVVYRVEGDVADFTKPLYIKKESPYAEFDVIDVPIPDKEGV